MMVFIITTVIILSIEHMLAILGDLSQATPHGGLTVGILLMNLHLVSGQGIKFSQEYFTSDE